ncbi:MAG: peptide deformylase [Senegalia sp. (in: firmicutes)]|uniref:peptide deformylase n=1 Tax=Senegalia sp. (in: firmicutes) TaxID=1924098 RepID=UPI003F99C717
MAIRQLRFVGDPILRKKSRQIDKIDDRVLTLLEDMVETMYKEEGIGLAAPQVGILKRAVVIDIGEGPMKIINPEIVYEEGEVIDVEGCLSVPDESGNVKRPEKIKVKYQNEEGKEVIVEAEELLARALCHEIDHLDGVLYIDKLEEEEE